MSTKMIFCIGIDLPDQDGIEFFKISSEVGLLDADIVVFRPCLNDFRCYDAYLGVSKISESDSAHFRNQRTHWRNQIKIAVEAGKTVIVILSEKQDRYFYTGTSEKSGTGKSLTTIMHVNQTNNYSLLPFSVNNIVFGSGNSMRLAPEAGVYKTFWDSFEGSLFYNCQFDDDQFTSIIRTRVGSLAVAGKSKTSNLILMPDINFDNVDLHHHSEETNKVEWSRNANELSLRLRACILDIDRQLRADAEVTPPPEWALASIYRGEVESLVENRIENISQKLEILISEKVSAQNELTSLFSLRSLLFEKGKPLEAAVRNALRIVGFETDTFKNGDSEFDAVFWGPEGRFIGEIEGKDNKPIAIEKASQLERNISEDFAREEVADRAHGVLFANAYRLMPVEARGDFFTQKVYTSADRSRIALVRTPDLFRVALYLRDNEDSEFAAICRESIVRGLGGLVRFPEMPDRKNSTVEDTVQGSIMQSGSKHD
ncbi:MAG: hypothetical protein JHC88_05675 [Niveispirillum sp.]|nr:hypothetical protein [Niveispirillum sp.]